jgi:hypothetical protein
MRVMVRMRALIITNLAKGDFGLDSDIADPSQKKAQDDNKI